MASDGGLDALTGPRNLGKVGQGASGGGLPRGEGSLDRAIIAMESQDVFEVAAAMLREGRHGCRRTGHGSNHMGKAAGQ